MTEVLCSGCKARSGYKYSSSLQVGKLMETTPYRPVLSHTGEMHFLCGGCFKRAQALAKQILEILNDENLYFPNLLSEK